MPPEKKRYERGRQYSMETSFTEKVDRIRRLFKEKYTCENIRQKPENKELIETFSGGKYGCGVEEFLKRRA